VNFSRVSLPLTMSAAFVLSGCIGGSAVDTAVPSSAAIETETSAASATTTTTTEPEETATETTATTEAPRPTPPESMPGDVIGFGPGAGDQIAVIGVEFDDVLNVRIAPGIDFDVVATLEPAADDVIAMGENRLLESSFWVEIETADGPGWVNEAYVGFLGVSQTLPSDLTAEDANAEELGLLVAQTYASEEPPSRITLQASDGDVVTYDVLGLGDDAVKGFRLVVETSVSGGDRVVVSVEEISLCGRGVDAELRCA